MIDGQTKRKQLEYHRKIVIAEADLHKVQRKQQTLVMDIKILQKKKRILDEKIAETERNIKKVDNDLYLLKNENKVLKKRLSRIS